MKPNTAYLKEEKWDIVGNEVINPSIEASFFSIEEWGRSPVTRRKLPCSKATQNKRNRERPPT